MNSTGRLLLRGGIVLTMDDDLGDFDRGDVLIEDGKIVQVGREVHADAEVLDCAGKIVLPGFVNSHHHMRPHGERMCDSVGTSSAVTSSKEVTGVTASSSPHSNNFGIDRRQVCR